MILRIMLGQRKTAQSEIFCYIDVSHSIDVSASAGEQPEDTYEFIIAFISNIVMDDAGRILFHLYNLLLYKNSEFVCIASSLRPKLYSRIFFATKLFFCPLFTFK